MNWIKKAKSAKDSKPKVLLLSLPEMWDMSESDLKPLREVAEVDWIQVKSITQDELAKKCEGYDYLMLNMDPMPFPDPNKMEKLTESFYDHPAVRRLKGINVDMTDVDFFSPGAAKKAGIPLQDSPDTTTESVAESALAEILLHARNRHLAYVDKIEGRDVECRKSMDLKGKIAGIIGKGNIGSRVGSFLNAIGMKVMFYDIDEKKGSKGDIDEIFKKADVISIHIPVHQPHTNKSNIGFIGKDLLEMCKGTIIVNLATDIIVDLEALESALKSGKVSAYSVETGRKKMEALKKYENVHISPCSYNSEESVRNIKKVWIGNMVSMIKGKPQNMWI